MNKLDYYYNTKNIDTYNATFNFIISLRCTGKTTAIFNKMYKVYRKTGQPAIIFRRFINDISSEYIDSLQGSINQFLNKNHKIHFKYKSNMSAGMVDVFDDKTGKLFCRIIGLNGRIDRLKSQYIERPSMIVVDEFIVCKKFKEKYLTEEVSKFQTVYDTYKRHCHKVPNDPSSPLYDLKCYFMGNPYSLVNPYFGNLNIDATDITVGSVCYFKRGFTPNTTTAIEFYSPKKKLLDKLFKDPNFNREELDEYNKMALCGIAVEDENYRIEKKQPNGYSLKYIIHINRRKLGIFKNGKNYWCSYIKYDGTKKIYAIDFDNLLDGTKLLNNEDKARLINLAKAIEQRTISFHSIQEASLIEDIYKIIK